MFRKRCSTCGAALVLVPTKSGKEMPCEEQPVPHHGVAAGTRYAVMRGNEGCEIVSGHELITLFEAFDAEDVRIFEPHWGNCNAPDKHRRRKR